MLTSSGWGTTSSLMYFVEILHFGFCDYYKLIPIYWSIG